MDQIMQTRYRSICRGTRGGMFYCVDTETGKRTSLQTANEEHARRIIQSKNEALWQPANLQIVKAYLAAADPKFHQAHLARSHGRICECQNWQQPHSFRAGSHGKGFSLHLQLLETRAEHFLRALQDGKVSTNNYLRRFHNFAVDMGWLPWPVLPKRRWPAIRYNERRAITQAEYELIISRESNQELQAFLWCCWHTGGSQSDVARLKAEDIDWQNRVVSFFRAKTGAVQIMRFGDSLAAVLKSLPEIGALFPALADMDEKRRAARFQRACRRVKITGVSLHSYRYAWAERAKVAGYPERFAQEALGHNSKAVHRAYARKAQVLLPPLEEYERRARNGNGLVIQPEPIAHLA
jgi:integrase